MRVTFDSNAWEAIFDPANTEWEPIRASLASGSIQGFICESAFRIEAIKKVSRADYFQAPKMDVRMDIEFSEDGNVYLVGSLGPADERHPGLPDTQSLKLQAAFSCGIRLLHGLNWLGLPRPKDILDSTLYSHETQAESRHRESRQIEIYSTIDQRNVGRRVFEAVGGWEKHPLPNVSPKAFQRACAEWADGETAIAHIAYKNDILCTNDHGKSANGPSIFDQTNRAWLTETYGVRFATLEQLMELGSEKL